MKNTARIEKLCVIFVFLAILIVGLCVFDDYGMSTDELVQRQHSILSYRTLNRILLGRDVFSDFGPASNLGDYEFKYYGVAIQLPLVFFEDVYQGVAGEPMPAHTIMLMRHLYMFLVYYFALVCFYSLVKRLFGNRWLALCGVLMVFLFGRFFAQSFYNIKDMVCASMTMVTICCAERVFATNRKPLWCALFALSGALLVTSRIVGALVIVFVLAAMLLQDLLAARQAKREGTAPEKRPVFKRLLPYALICCAYPVWLLITPASWSDPIGFSLGYIGKFSNYDVWHGTFAFAGRLINEATVPRWYFITWIALTVPIVNQLLCLTGIGFFAIKPKQSGLCASSRTILWLSLFMLVGTFGYQALAQPVAYGDWRHVYYLYPLMILFAVYGLSLIWAFVAARKKIWPRVCVVCILVCTLGCNAYRIAAAHPNEYALFNVVGKNYARGFERDYWGLTYRDMAQWLLENADGDPITVNLDHLLMPGYPITDRIHAGFPEEDYARFQFCDDETEEYRLFSYNYLRMLTDTDMFLSNDYPIDGFREVHAVWLDGIKLAAVYQRIPEA